MVNENDNTVSTYLGTGTGAFTFVGGFGVGSSPDAVAAGDLNGDGKPDLVVANGYWNSVSVLLGLGGGKFASATSVPVGLSPTGVALGDLNGDGRLDLVASNYYSNSVSVLLGNGSGGFAPRGSFPVNTGPRGVVLADLNGDGRLDVATANGPSNNVSVLIGDGSGGFTPWALAPFATDKSPVALAAGDFNGDGATDVATANATSNDVSVLLNQSGTKTALTATPNPSTAGEAVTLTATVTHTSGTLAPTGSVTFKDGGAAIGSAPLTAGVATFITSTLAAALHSLTAAYSGDGNYSPSVSGAVAQTVHAIPSAGAITGAPNPADVTQTVSLSSSPSGGTGSYTYAWSLTSRPAGSSAALTSSSAASPSFTADVAGSYGIQLVVTDGHGVASPPSLASITANADPGTPVISVSPGPADVNQVVALSAALSGGTGPFTYAWAVTVPAGSLATLSSTGAPNPTLKPDLPGAYVVRLVVTDSNSLSSLAGFATLAVNPAPHAGVISYAPNPADAGQTVTVSATAGGGTGTLAYAWSLTVRPLNSNATISSSSAASPSFVADLPGSYTVALTVTDANGVSSSAIPLVINALAAPSIASISATPDPADAGQRVTLGAAVSGGNGGYSYAWSVTSPFGVVTNLAGPTPSFIATDTGSYSIKLVVTDGNSVGSAPLSRSLNVNSDPLAGAVTATPNPADISQVVNLGAAPSGGTGAFAYSWTLTAPSWT